MGKRRGRGLGAARRPFRSPRPRHRTAARRITATVATVAAWTAVAGIGTYGTFPASTQGGLAPAGRKVSLALDGAAGSVEVPLEFSGLIPAVLSPYWFSRS